jgi:nitronate monooxygenase
MGLVTIDAVDGGPDARTAPRRSWWRTAFADVRDRRAAELRASASARDRFARGHQAGNPGVGLVWAGEGTDLITAVEPAGNLVAQIVTQTERLLRGTSRLAAP